MAILITIGLLKTGYFYLRFFLSPVSDDAVLIVQPEESSNQSINQSINQSVNQSINQSINPSINQSIHQSVNQSINQSLNPSINQTIHQSINQSINPGLLSTRKQDRGSRCNCQSCNYNERPHSGRCWHVCLWRLHNLLLLCRTLHEDNENGNCHDPLIKNGVEEKMLIPPHTRSEEDQAYILNISSYWQWVVVPVCKTNIETGRHSYDYSEVSLLGIILEDQVTNASTDIFSMDEHPTRWLGLVFREEDGELCDGTRAAWQFNEELKRAMQAYNI